jgi:hypothetical protein
MGDQMKDGFITCQSAFIYNPEFTPYVAVWVSRSDFDLIPGQAKEQPFGQGKTAWLKTIGSKVKVFTDQPPASEGFAEQQPDSGDEIPRNTNFIPKKGQTDFLSD